MRQHCVIRSVQFSKAMKIQENVYDIISLCGRRNSSFIVVVVVVGGRMTKKKVKEGSQSAPRKQHKK